MLAFAQRYQEELEKKMLDTWGKEKYWFYNNSSYFSQVYIENDTWNNTRFVSVNASGEVIGYLGYGVEREGRYVTYLAILNFTDDNSFGLDVMALIRDIFEKYQYRKICFTVVVGNPVEAKYDRLIRRYGGRIVGIHKEHTMLPDGRLYDEKMYEIFRIDYLEHRKNVSSTS